MTKRKILIFIAIAICWGVVSVCWFERSGSEITFFIQGIAFLVFLRMVFFYLEVIRDEIIQALKRTSDPKSD